MSSSHEYPTGSPELPPPQPEVIGSGSGERSKKAVYHDMAAGLRNLIRKGGALPQPEPALEGTIENDTPPATDGHVPEAAPPAGDTSRGHTENDAPLPPPPGERTASTRSQEEPASTPEPVTDTVVTYGYGDFGGIKKVDREIAASYFEARTPWSQRSKIVDIITEKLDQKVLPLLSDEQKAESQAPIRNQIEAIKQAAATAREEVLGQKYRGRLIKNLQPGQLPKIREEIIDLQKQLGKLRQHYGAEANLALSDDSEYLQENGKYKPNLEVRRQAKELGEGIGFRLSILAAVAGEDYYTGEQEQQLLALYGQVESKRLELTRAQPSEEDQKKVELAELQASYQRDYPEYFNDRLWLGIIVAHLKEQILQAASESASILSPQEFSALKETISLAAAQQLVEQKFNKIDENTPAEVRAESDALRDVLAQMFLINLQ